MVQSQKQLDNLKKGAKFKKGESGNPNGRPKKVATKLKGLGYSPEEISDTILILMAKTQDQLKKIALNKKTTALEAIIIKAIGKSIGSGKVLDIMSLVTRAIGQPVQTVNHGGNVLDGLTINVVGVEPDENNK